MIFKTATGGIFAAAGALYHPKWGVQEAPIPALPQGDIRGTYQNHILSSRLRRASSSFNSSRNSAWIPAADVAAAGEESAPAIS